MRISYNLIDLFFHELQFFRKVLPQKLNFLHQYFIVILILASLEHQFFEVFGDKDVDGLPENPFPLVKLKIFIHDFHHLDEHIQQSQVRTRNLTVLILEIALYCHLYLVL